MEPSFYGPWSPHFVSLSFETTGINLSPLNIPEYLPPSSLEWPVPQGQRHSLLCLQNQRRPSSSGLAVTAEWRKHFPARLKETRWASQRSLWYWMGRMELGLALPTAVPWVGLHPHGPAAWVFNRVPLGKENKILYCKRLILIFVLN